VGSNILNTSRKYAIGNSTHNSPMYSMKKGTVCYSLSLNVGHVCIVEFFRKKYSLYIVVLNVLSLPTDLYSHEFRKCSYHHRFETMA